MRYFRICWILLFINELYYIQRTEVENDLLFLEFIQLFIFSLLMLQNKFFCLKVFYGFFNFFISITLLAAQAYSGYYVMSLFTLALFVVYGLIYYSILQNANIMRITVFEEDCTICLSNENGQITLSCSHHFHRQCINNWLSLKNECPICRVLVDYPQ